MNGIIFKLLSTGVAAACLSACARKNTIANEDFEGTQPSVEIGSHSRITGEKTHVIGGSRSLFCKAPEDKPATAFEVSSDKFNVFEVSFNYKTVGGSHRAATIRSKTTI